MVAILETFHKNVVLVLILSNYFAFSETQVRTRSEWHLFLIN